MTKRESSVGKRNRRRERRNEREMFEEGGKGSKKLGENVERVLDFPVWTNIFYFLFNQLWATFFPKE